MSVRPVWRKKLNYCNTFNVVDVNLPTQENSHISQSNQDSLQPHSLPLGDPCVTRVDQALIPPQSVNKNQPPYPHSLINTHVASVLHDQSPPSPQGDNQTPPIPPSSLSRKMLVDDINQLQDLSNLFAMHPTL
ncbi:hypothetical protein Tco_0578928 [Tanacetum coccineum]